MANFKAPDLRNRAPKVDLTPDFRERVTRVYDILDEVPKNQTAGTVQPGLSAYWLPWGTPDAVYTNCRLVAQKVEGQFEINGTGDNPTAKLPTLTRIYEQLPATAELFVGEPEVQIGQDGIYTVILNYLQFSVAVAGVTQIFETVGTTGISSPVAAVLKLEERTDDGTIQKIKRTYTSAGLINQDVETKFNGGLVITTLTTVNQVPATPSGATLIDAKVNFVNGLPVRIYTFAKGGGQISSSTEYRLSPDQGTTGVTVQTITWLTPPASSNPITPPGGYEEISLKWDDADGYMSWTGVYAFGQGYISTEIEYRNGGKLLLTTITSINAAPSTPSPSIGGTPTLVKNETRNGTRFEDGTIIYTYTWAEGQGEISRNIVYENSVDQGTHGITKTTIKYLTATSVSSNPITGPGGSILQTVDRADEGGYRVWTGVYVQGTGNISTETETKEYGKLVIYKITALNSAPSTPSSTIGGTVVLIDAESKLEGGLTVYSYRWAEGYGTILTETNTIEAGALVVYHSKSLGVAPATPSATIGGTVTLFESEVSNADGYQIYDYRWVEANGQSSITTRGEPDGALLYEVVTKNAGASTPAYPGSGTAYLVDLVQNQGDGYMTNRATYKKPPATVALRKTMKFKMPGQISILSSPAGLAFIPPVDMDILATETISYSTSQTTTAPFTVSAYPFVTITTVPTNQATPKQTVTTQEAAAGYLAGATGSSGSASTFNGVLCDSWAYSITGSTPSSPPSGATTIETNNDIYLTSITGTVVYRTRVVTYSF